MCAISDCFLCVTIYAKKKKKKKKKRETERKSKADFTVREIYYSNISKGTDGLSSSGDFRN